jgi:hypothetical protein
VISYPKSTRWSYKRVAGVLLFSFSIKNPSLSMWNRALGIGGSWRHRLLVGGACGWVWGRVLRVGEFVISFSTFPCFFFWVEMLRIMLLKVTDESAMAPLPSSRRIPFSIYRSLLVPHRWVSIEFLVRLVLVAERMVVGNGKTKCFQWALLASHGGRRPELKKEAELLSVKLGVNVNR